MLSRRIFLMLPFASCFVKRAKGDLLLEGDSYKLPSEQPSGWRYTFFSRHPKPKFPMAVPTAYPDMFWGTYGKNGDQPLSYAPLGSRSTEHLKAILRTQHQLSVEYRAIIVEILIIRHKMEKDNPELRKVHYEDPEALESHTA